MNETHVAHHAWQLDRREVERHLTRRGRRHAFERTADLVALLHRAP